MKQILLSQKKIQELRKELEQLERDIKQHHEDEHETILTSMKEAASFDIAIRAKESRLKTINKILKIVKILPERVNSEKITLGSRVEIKNGEGKIIKYRLVHPLEADPEKGLLSVESPFGKLLLNRKRGKKIELEGKGFTIISIR